MKYRRTHDLLDFPNKDNYTKETRINFLQHTFPQCSNNLLKPVVNIIEG